MAAQKPPQPPKADMAQLVKRVNDLSLKAGLPAFISQLPAWKRYVGSEDEHDGKGLRDTVNANAYYTDAIKGDVDALGQAIIEIRSDVQALKEAPAARPFP